MWIGDRYGMTWQDRRTGNYEVFFNTLGADGAKKMADVELTFDPGFSVNPAIAWNGSEFIVAWQDDRNGPFDVYVQRVDARGTLLGGNLQLTQGDMTFGNESPSIAPGLKGVGVAWSFGDALHHIIDFQVWSPDLSTPIIPSINVTDGTTAAEYPVVVWNKDRYVVAWYDKSASPQAIYAAAFLEDGTPLIPPRPITSPGAFRSRYPFLNPLGDRILVVYADDRDQNTGYELYTRMIHADLSPLGGELRVTDAPRDSVFPIAAFGPKGDFGVLFRDDREAGAQNVYFTELTCFIPSLGPSARSPAALHDLAVVADAEAAAVAQGLGGGVAQLGGDDPLAEGQALGHLVLHPDRLLGLEQLHQRGEALDVVLRERGLHGVEADGLVHVLEEGGDGLAYVLGDDLFEGLDELDLGLDVAGVLGVEAAEELDERVVVRVVLEQLVEDLDLPGELLALLDGDAAEVDDGGDAVLAGGDDALEGELFLLRVGDARVDDEGEALEERRRRVRRLHVSELLEGLHPVVGLRLLVAGELGGAGDLLVGGGLRAERLSPRREGHALLLHEVEKSHVYLALAIISGAPLPQGLDRSNHSGRPSVPMRVRARCRRSNRRAARVAALAVGHGGRRGERRGDLRRPAHRRAPPTSRCSPTRRSRPTRSRLRGATSPS